MVANVLLNLDEMVMKTVIARIKDMNPELERLRSTTRRQFLQHALARAGHPRKAVWRGTLPMSR